MGAWIAIELLIPMGPPIQGPTYFDFPADAYLRHSALMVAGLLALGGFAILTAALLAAGERVLSMLGFAAITLATGFHLVVQALSATGLGRVLPTSGIPSHVAPRLHDFVLFVAFFPAECAFLATGFYAAASPQLGLRKTGSRALALVCFCAAGVFAVAAIATLVFHVPRRSPWSIGGVLGIPAIPYVLPYFMGVSLLRRAGEVGDVVKSKAA